MLTHAEYIAAKPLPYFPAPLRIEYAVEPEPGYGRVHRLVTVADTSLSSVPDEDYIAVLSRTEWIDSNRLSILLDVTQTAAKARMDGPTLSKITERRKDGRKYVWRLK